MTTHSSATLRAHTPHVNRTTRTATIINALKQRALAILNDESTDAQNRAAIRYALETHDPWLARLVRQAEAGESIVNLSDFDETLANSEQDLHKRVEALAEIICAAGDDSSAALLVLMGVIQNSTEPQALANTVKHFAFTCCGELNVRGMVDTQVAVFGDQLFSA